MAAITWKNIEAPDFRAASGLMGRAESSFNAVGDGITNALKTYQNDKQKALEYRKEQNTNEYLNSLYSQYATPEALQAAIANGDIGRQMQAYGNEMDFKQTRGAAEKLLGDKQTRELSSLQFKDALLKDKNMPLLGQAQAAAYAGDKARADQLQAQIDPRFQGDLAKTRYAIDGTEQERGFAKSRDARAQSELEIHQAKLQMEQEQNPLKKALMAAQIKSQEADAFYKHASGRAATARASADSATASSAKASDRAVSLVTSTINQKIDKNKTDVDAFALTQPSMVPIKNGKPDYKNMTVDQKDAFKTLAETKGLDFDMRIGLKDAELSNQALTALSSVGVSGKRLVDVKEQMPNLVGEGRFISAEDTVAGKKQSARDAKEIQLAKQKVGGLVPVTDTDVVIAEALKSIPKGHQENAIAGFMSAISKNKGLLKDTNGSEFTLDGKTVAKIFNKEIGAGVGYLWDTKPSSDQFAKHIINYIERNEKELRKSGDLQLKKELDPLR